MDLGGLTDVGWVRFLADYEVCHCRGEVRFLNAPPGLQLARDLVLDIARQEISPPFEEHVRFLWLPSRRI